MTFVLIPISLDFPNPFLDIDPQSFMVDPDCIPELRWAVSIRTLAPFVTPLREINHRGFDSDFWVFMFFKTPLGRQLQCQRITIFLVLPDRKSTRLNS